MDVAIKYLLEIARQIARSGVLDTLIRVERSTVGLAKRGWKMLPTDCRPRLSARRVLVEFNLAASCGFLSCVIDELFLGLQVLGGTARERVWPLTSLAEPADAFSLAGQRHLGFSYKHEAQASELLGTDTVPPDAPPQVRLNTVRHKTCLSIGLVPWLVGWDKRNRGRKVWITVTGNGRLVLV